MNYNPKEIEKKWQKYWYQNKIFEAVEKPNQKKFYGLIEFPYPSGSGLHVGHIRAFTSMEVISRKRRLQGYNVLFPIGYDAFGLPTENYAIKTKTHPRIVTDRNIKMFEKQMKRIGYGFDWDRVIDTTDENYYKWTQWIFLQMFKKGLAYKAKTLVNFCPECKVVLANEESQNGICDRCGSEVVQKEKDVWFLKIRAYAERLLAGLDKLDYPEKIKVEQQNWIGKSNGADVKFTIKDNQKQKEIVVYTTRPDTIFGATFLVIAPEHPIVEEFIDSLENIEEVREYQRQAKLKKEFERVHMSKEKSGVRLNGICAVNPLTNKEIPVFIADYVIMDYGTGAIMAVPAHDTRDYEFAKKYNLPIIEVIKGGDIEKEAYVSKEGGEMVNSGFLNGMDVPQAIEAMIAYMSQKGIGTPKTDYKMKDWAFNRQRYWGEPIPIINCEKCGQVPMDEKDLPLKLPELDDFTPADDASSPLAKVTEWVNTVCPKCGGKATRETDTMPQWAGSSWYYLRYMSPRDNEHAVNPEAYKYWGQVDWYNGGMEHVTRHLIYSRFWNMFLYDIGAVTHEEPYKKRTAQGLILGADGEKMSKSRNNVVNPDDVVDEYGADVLRMFILFIGDYEKSAPWNPDAIKGCQRFLNKFWNLMDMIKEGDTKGANIDYCIKKVDEDLETLKFNTAIAQIMSTVNDIYQRGYVTKEELNKLIIILNPIAPHITSEMYEIVNGGAKIEKAQWPQYDESKLTFDVVDIPVQINGKLRARISVNKDATEQEALDNVKNNTKVLDGKQIIKVIYVPGRIINIIVK
ncbi:MAG: leucine--tRNA ligase [Christensenellales bacterium]|jgi:leucyl-tRNA synthetase|nr:leucine--tRNA ligase [Clostridiales bacterium]